MSAGRTRNQAPRSAGRPRPGGPDARFTGRVVAVVKVTDSTPSGGGWGPAAPAAPVIVLRDPCLVKPLRTTLSVTAPTGASAHVKRVRDWARTM